MSQALSSRNGGLWLRRDNGHGAFWLLLAGMAATPAWRFGPRFNIEGLPGVHEIFLAFCLSPAAYVVLSHLTRRHPPAEGHVAHPSATERALPDRPQLISAQLRTFVARR